MITPAKKPCAFCLSPTHHTSVLHVLANEMQLEALWGNPAFFLKMQLQGQSWENLGEFGRAAEICVDLWEAVESQQRAVGIVGASLTSHQIKRKRMDM